MQNWLLYDLLMGVAPAILVAFVFWLMQKPKTLEIIGDGQLFFFCTALAGTTCGALIEHVETLSRSQRDVLPLCVGILLFLIIFASCAFGTSTLAEAQAKPRIAKTSLWLSVGAILLVGSMRAHFAAW